jgi:hypothetical protein
MDYRRIYFSFIADRRMREAALTGYSERHHITPRSEGGTDCRDNLISLSPEDHFFAHLVLAKWLNTMAAWSAVMIMHERSGRSSLFTRRSRNRYAWARRRFSIMCTVERLGKANPNYKAEAIALKHLSGECAARTRSEWSAAGVSHSPLCALMSGKSLSYKGWMLPDTNAAAIGRVATGLAKRNSQLYTWVNLNGVEERLSPFDLAEKYGLRASDLNAVARGQHKMASGWSVRGRATGWPSGRKSLKDERVYTFVHQDGRSVEGVQTDLIRFANIPQRDVSAIVRGARKSAGGWMRKDVAASGYAPRRATRCLRTE